MRLHQRHVEGAQLDWFTWDGDDKRLLRQPVSAPDIGRRLPPDQLGSGTVGDQRGIHRVVDVSVHRDNGRQPGDIGPGKATVDPLR
ncbi:Uncharacterised protein [Mycobacterium tuberculosis]|uniref:Uncharacterized protein n=1 Tax=Mycobacterium tuberculosis TaxID=1773 RepID=A0A0T7PMQ4_MYCTX|nr:Uncharacterised protein [Mycobacterium tuberculosis]CFS16556.1 Uncharacterised protein [Mycobacterium tuberculosis]CKP70978.1 Uncharacterised protein [Mycobacterium tuberculosis]CKT86152.1 Uncharacterised protein [Mycobacterium tuberculosis]CKU67488.1 Uncharacterised protein [Mycobacterium tuberculosis]